MQWSIYLPKDVQEFFYCFVVEIAWFLKVLNTEAVSII